MLAKLKWAALRFCVLLIIVLVFLYLLQDRLLYHPDKYPLTYLSSQAAGRGLRLWPSPAAYRGLLAEAPAGRKVRGTALVVHGNAGSALNRTFYLEPLRARDYRVLLLEYPGYGPREGKLGEQSLVGDLAESIRLAREQWGGPVVLIGESLGSGVAAAALARLEEPVAGVILFTPWDDLPSVAQAIYWFLPVKFLARDKYNSVEHLRSRREPLAVVLAGRDEVIPARCSRRLLESLPEPKKHWVIPGATHNSWPEAVDDRWWSEVLDYVHPDK